MRALLGQQFAVFSPSPEADDSMDAANTAVMCDSVLFKMLSAERNRAVDTEVCLTPAASASTLALSPASIHSETCQAASRIESTVNVVDMILSAAAAVAASTAAAANPELNPLSVPASKLPVGSKSNLATGIADVCQICTETVAGFHCNAFVCEACKKFYVRSCKNEQKNKYVCTKGGKCKVTRESRTHCQFCRFKKCLFVGMSLEASTQRNQSPSYVTVTPCEICGAESSGFHFGAVTCEGCKGFFRRTLTENEKRGGIPIYVCNHHGRCEVNRLNRNNCKACRFQACLDKGMSKFGSRIGRKSNAMKMSGQSGRTALMIAESPASQTSGESISPRNHLDEAACPIDGVTVCPNVASYEDLSLLPGHPSVYQTYSTCDQLATSERRRDTQIMTESLKPSTFGYHQNVLRRETSGNNYFIEFINQITAAFQELKLSKNYYNSKFPIIQVDGQIDEHELWNEMMPHFENHTKTITLFARRVPGFNELDIEDRKTIVKESIYPIVLIRLSQDYNKKTGEFNYFDFNVVERNHILSVFPTFLRIAEHLRAAGMILGSNELSDIEVALLCTICLFRQELADLKEPWRVSEFYTKSINSLKYFETDINCNPARLHSLTQILGYLSSMNIEHHFIIRSLRRKKPHLKFPTLYVEVFQLKEARSQTECDHDRSDGY